MTIVAAIPACALLVGTAVGIYAPLPIACYLACATLGWGALSCLLGREITLQTKSPLRRWCQAPVLGTGRRPSRLEGLDDRPDTPPPARPPSPRERGEGWGEGRPDDGAPCSPWPWFVVVAAATGFLGGGAALAADAARRALTPPILADSESSRTDVVGSAGAMPMTLSGRLRTDAVATEFGAAFTIDLEHVRVVDRVDRGDRGDRADRADGVDRADGADRGDQGNRGQRVGRGEPADRGQRPEPREPREPRDRPERPEPRERPEQPERPDRGGGAARVERVERATAGPVRIAVGGASAASQLAAWRAGRRVRVTATLSAPQPYRNIGTVDQETRLALAGIRLFGSVKSASHVELLARGRWWEEAAAAARLAVRRAVAIHVGGVGRTVPADGDDEVRPPNARSAAIVAAILIGDRAGLSEEVEERLQRAGTFHVIAISGGNVAILTALILAVLRVLGLPPRSSAVLTLVAIAIYAVIVGAGASVARASLAACVYLFARAIDHRTPTLNVLAVVVCAILIWAPLEIVDAGFWLTCLATFAIIWLTPAIADRTRDAIHHVAAVPRLIVAATAHAVTASAQATTATTTTRATTPTPTPTTATATARATATATATSPAIATATPATAATQATTASMWRGRLARSARITTTGIAAALAGRSRARARWRGALSGVGRRVLDVSIALFAATIATEAVLLPVTAFAFSQVSIAGLLLNFAAIPLMTVVQLAGLVVVVGGGAGGASSAWLTPLADLAGDVVRVAANGLVESARLVDVAAWSASRVPPPPLWLVLACHACLAAAWFAYPHTRLRHCAAAAWLACTALVVIAWPLPSFLLQPVGAQACQLAPLSAAASPRLSVTVLDVAQGDATLVRWPDGSTWLIDAGGALGRFDVGTRVVSPALWALAVRRLSTLVLTHGDLDHIGGAGAVIRDFAPAEIWEGIPVAGHPMMGQLQRQAHARGLQWRSVRAGYSRPGYRRRAGGDAIEPAASPTTSAAAGTVADVAGTAADVRVWHPPEPAWLRTRSRNDDSIVLEITFGQVSVVLPGDISGDAERALAARWSTRRSDDDDDDDDDETGRRRHATRDDAAIPRGRAPTASIRVLKTPHHGSRTSSTARFLDALGPQLAIVSAGRGNRHGHPDADVLARHASRGIPVLRTDRDGAVQLDTDGRTCVVRTCSGQILHLGPSGILPP